MSAPPPPTEVFPPLSKAETFATDIRLADDPAISTRPVWSVVLLAWLVRLSALINLVSSLLPEKPHLFVLLGTWAPFEISEGRRLRTFLLSLLLFSLAAGLMRGKRMAWTCTIGALALAPFLHFGRTDILPQLLVNLPLVGLLYINRRYFVAASDPHHVRRALIICPLLALALLGYGTVRLHELRYETSGPDSWLGCLQAACELIFVHNAFVQGAQSLRSFDFFATLRLGGTLIALLGLFLGLRPVLLRRRTHEGARHEVRLLIDRHGHDFNDPYALLSDKSYHFTENRQAVVPFALSDNIAVVMGDPIGAREMRARAIDDFIGLCRRHDWEPVFYAVGEDMIADYKQAGLSLFKIGEEARVRLDRFDLRGVDFQNLRTLRNGAYRLGIRFRWYDASRGVEELLERELAGISRGWLEMKNAGEMGFDMGAFSIEEIRRHGAAVAIDASGKPLAFATWRPFAQGRGRVLDLMRSLPRVKNVMDFVLVESIFHFKSMGIAEVSLGLAPLANTNESPSRLVAEEKVIQFLFENLNHFYAYKSLFEFKRKYRPQWRGRYVAYHRGVHLPMVGLALVRVHAPEGLWKVLTRSARSNSDGPGKVFATGDDDRHSN